MYGLALCLPDQRCIPSFLSGHRGDRCVSENQKKGSKKKPLKTQKEKKQAKKEKKDNKKNKFVFDE